MLEVEIKCGSSRKGRMRDDADEFTAINPLERSPSTSYICSRRRGVYGFARSATMSIFSNWTSYEKGTQQNFYRSYKTRSGDRARGRPRYRWIDNIKDILDKHKYSATEATHLVMERTLKLPSQCVTASVDQQYNHPLGV